MARQHVHNRRAGRGNSGSVWISYSDMMAALVLMFVLFMVYNLHSYNSVLEKKTRELDEKTIQVNTQKAQLDEYQGILIIQQNQLDTQQKELQQLQLDLADQKDKLDQQTIILIGQQQELENAKATLAAKETQLNQLQLQLGAQQQLFEAKTRELDALVGVRTQIIQELSAELRANNLNAQVDPNTGDIVLESTVFFESNSYNIKPEGQELLRRFLPVYLSVLTKEAYRDYLGEIIVEGHTDSDGTYLNNLRLSQNRALSVVIYCLDIVDPAQHGVLQSVLTAKGRASNELVYYPDGTENKSASRRVEFKFSLKDSEMIDEMNRILNMNEGGSGTGMTIATPSPATTAMPLPTPRVTQ